jgi:hypothetical protein
MARAAWRSLRVATAFMVHETNEAYAILRRVLAVSGRMK